MAMNTLALLDNNGVAHDFSHTLSGCNVFVLTLVTLYCNFALI